MRHPVLNDECREGSSHILVVDLSLWKHVVLIESIIFRMDPIGFYEPSRMTMLISTLIYPIPHASSFVSRL